MSERLTAEERVALEEASWGHDFDNWIAAVEGIVAARVAEALAPVAGLADRWDQQYRAQHRISKNHRDARFWTDDRATELRRALAADRAEGAS